MYSSPHVVHHRNGKKSIGEDMNKPTLFIVIEMYKKSFDYIL